MISKCMSRAAKDAESWLLVGRLISPIRASYTTSLASSITDYKIENSRRYHAYKEGSGC